MVRTDHEKKNEDIAFVWGAIGAAVLLTGYLWLVHWLVSNFLLVILLLAAGIFPLLMFISAVGFVVSLAAIIAGED